MTISYYTVQPVKTEPSLHQIPYLVIQGVLFRQVLLFLELAEKSFYPNLIIYTFNYVQIYLFLVSFQNKLNKIN